MKRILSRTLFAFTFLIITTSAQATIISMAQIGFEGKTYNVMTIFGAVSDEPKSFWESQPWWGDETFAREFAAAIGVNLGAPNGGFGPYLLYEDIGEGFNYAYCSNPFNCDRAEEASTGFAEQSEELYFTKATIVPIPAAAWLFGSALLGLVGYSRRKANA